MKFTYTLAPLKRLLDNVTRVRPLSSTPTFRQTRGRLETADLPDVALLAVFEFVFSLFSGAWTWQLCFRV